MSASYLFSTRNTGWHYDGEGTPVGVYFVSPATTGNDFTIARITVSWAPSDVANLQFEPIFELGSANSTDFAGSGITPGSGGMSNSFFPNYLHDVSPAGTTAMYTGPDGTSGDPSRHIVWRPTENNSVLTLNYTDLGDGFWCDTGNWIQLMVMAQYASLTSYQSPPTFALNDFHMSVIVQE